MQGRKPHHECASSLDALAIRALLSKHDYYAQHGEEIVPEALRFSALGFLASPLAQELMGTAADFIPGKRRRFSLAVIIRAGFALKT
jgi:hypothetical protein